MLEWRVTWKVGDTLVGSSRWEPWDDPDMDADEIRDEVLDDPAGANPSMAHQVFWEESGVTLDVETRAPIGGQTNGE